MPRRPPANAGSGGKTPLRQNRCSGAPVRYAGVGAAVAAESEDVGSLLQPAKPSIKTAAKTAPTAAARYFFVLCLYMRSPF